MIVREAASGDLTAMVDLLKQSIGETLTPKTERYFTWKHEKNPFGKSKVLLAIEDNKIVGLRAFMHWSWVQGEQTIRAVRAVDTATDPAFQGKGIFKKLTLQAVDECRAEGVSLVFNSPNPISMQGYLKMGWSLAGRLPLYIRWGVVLPASFNEKKIDHIYNEYSIATALSKLAPGWKVHNAKHIIHTPVNEHYLGWRFRDCPVAKYGAIIEPGKYGFIFRVKKVKQFMELRICEAWTENNNGATAKEARKACKKLVKKLKPLIVTCAETPLFNEGNKKLLKFFGPFKKGPIITIRPLASENLNNFENFKAWEPSLGAMELF